MGDLRFLKSQQLNQSQCQCELSHIQRFEHFLESGYLSDAEIFIGSGVHKELFKIHKLIIAIGSPILFENITKSPESCIVIENIEPSIFGCFLKFLYTGTCQLEVEKALPLLQLAVRYNVPDLLAKCKDFLKEDLTDESAVTIYQQAINYDEIKLAEKALRYICRNAWNIIETDEFTKLKPKNLQNLLRNDDLLVLSEAQLIKGLLRWGNVECKRQGLQGSKQEVRNALEDILWLIQWDRIDIGAFDDDNMSFEIEKLYAVFLGFKSNEQNFASKISRKYFEEDDNAHILSRLPHKFAYCSDNKIEGDSEVIRFKTDHSLCLISIGVPAYSQTCGDFFNVNITISDPMLKSTMKAFEKVGHHTEMYHVKFPSPYKIRKNTWYTITGMISGTPGYGNTGGKSVAYAKCFKSNETETLVKFEFKASNNNLMDGGQIDEFLFKLAEN